MTVQEAKESIEYLKMQLTEDLEMICFTGDELKALDMSIQALEEVEQYRALGTVEELKEAREKQPKTDWIPCEERLPNKGDVVLAQYHGWNGFDKIVMAYIREDDEWKIEFGGVCNYSSILAWQPLPQPYKKEGSE